jgi:hypothetical protein
MIDPIVSTKSSYDYIPGLSKVIHTIRKHFEYKAGNDVVAIETYVIQLYNKNGNLTEHNSSPKIDKLA